MARAPRHALRVVAALGRSRSGGFGGVGGFGGLGIGGGGGGRREPIALWRADDSTGAFSATLTDTLSASGSGGLAPPSDLSVLTLGSGDNESDDDEEIIASLTPELRPKIAFASTSLSLVLRCDGADVEVRDALNRPLLVARLGALDAGGRFGGRAAVGGGAADKSSNKGSKGSTSTVQAYAGVTASIWAFNPALGGIAGIGGWEPVLEPVPLIVKADSSSSANGGGGRRGSAGGGNGSSAALSSSSSPSSGGARFALSNDVAAAAATAGASMLVVSVKAAPSDGGGSGGGGVRATASFAAAASLLDAARGWLPSSRRRAAIAAAAASTSASSAVPASAAAANASSSRASQGSSGRGGGGASSAAAAASAAAPSTSSSSSSNAAADGGVRTCVFNALRHPADILIVAGSGRRELVPLLDEADDGGVDISLPLPPRPPLPPASITSSSSGETAAAAAEASPARLLAVTVLQAVKTETEEGGAASSLPPATPPELFLRARLSSSAPSPSSSEAAADSSGASSARTRSRLQTASSPSYESVFRWDETLLLSLDPPAAAELMSRGAESGGGGASSAAAAAVDYGNDAAEVKIILELVDASARAGRGRIVASGILSPRAQAGSEGEEAEVELSPGGWKLTLHASRLESGGGDGDEDGDGSNSSPSSSSSRAVGRRALRVGGPRGIWVPLPPPALGRAGAAAAGDAERRRPRGGVGSSDAAAAAADEGPSSASSDVVAVRLPLSSPVAPGEGVAIEASLTPWTGERSETLRSLCCVENCCPVAVAVCLERDSDTSDVSGIFLPSTDYRTSRSRSRSSSTISDVAPLSLLPPRRTLDGGAVEVSVFENQRYIPLRGWGSRGHLLPTDRFRRFVPDDGRSPAGGRADSSWEFPAPALPRGWEWEGAWQVDRGGAGAKSKDGDGWSYASDFGSLYSSYLSSSSSLPASAGSRGPVDFVRRRRLVRRRAPVARLAGEAGGDEGGVGSAAGATSSMQRLVLGVVPPGGRLPLPLGWRNSDAQVSVRPVLPRKKAAVVESRRRQRQRSEGEEEDEEEIGGDEDDVEEDEEDETLFVDDEPDAFGWSVGVAGGTHSLPASDVGEGVTRLVACARARRSADDDSDSAAPVELAWLSLAVEGDPLPDASRGVGDGGGNGGNGRGGRPSSRFASSALSSRASALIDWRIRVCPPVTLAVDLPVSCAWSLWELASSSSSSSSSSSLQARQVATGATPAGGGCAPVISADPRKPLALTLEPEGHDWAPGATPAMVIAGTSGASAGVAAFSSSSKAASGASSSSSSSSSALQLPSTLRVRRRSSESSGGTVIDLVISRELDSDSFIGGNVHNFGGDVFSSAAAAGVPLTVRVGTPAWLVNELPLPLHASLVPAPRVSAASAAATAAPAAAAAAAEAEQGETGGFFGDSTPFFDVGGDTSSSSSSPVLRGPPPSVERMAVGPRSVELVGLAQVLAAACSSSSSGANGDNNGGGGGGGGGFSAAACSSSAVIAAAAASAATALRLIVCDSAWTPPMPLAPSAASSSAGGAAASAGEASSLISPPIAFVTARSRSWGLCADVVVRAETVEVGGSGRGGWSSGIGSSSSGVNSSYSSSAAAGAVPASTSLVIRVSPRFVASNVTGVPMQVSPYVAPEEEERQRRQQVQHRPGFGGMMASSPSSAARAGGASAPPPPVIDLPPGGPPVALLWPLDARRRAVRVRIAPRGGGNGTTTTPAGPWSLPIDVDATTDGDAVAALPVFSTSSPALESASSLSGDVSFAGIRRTPSSRSLGGAGGVIASVPLSPASLPEEVEEALSGEGATATLTVFAAAGSSSTSRLPATPMRYSVSARGAGGNASPTGGGGGSPGQLCLELLSVAAAPAAALANASDAPLRWRPILASMENRGGGLLSRGGTLPSSSSVPWSQLPPLSSVAVLPHTDGGGGGRGAISTSTTLSRRPRDVVEVADGLFAVEDDTNAAARFVATYALAASEGGSSTATAKGRLSLPPLRVEDDSESEGSSSIGSALLVACSDGREPAAAVSASGSPAPIAGGGGGGGGGAGNGFGGGGGGGEIGRSPASDTLRLAPLPRTTLQLSASSSSSSPPYAAPGFPVFVTLEAESLELSIVDHRPEELACLTLTRGRVALAWGLGPLGAFSRVAASAGGLQLDDMSHAPRFPVVFGADDDTVEGDQRTSSSSSGPLPMVRVLAVRATGGAAIAVSSSSSSNSSSSSSSNSDAAAAAAAAEAVAAAVPQAAGVGAYYPLLTCFVERGLRVAVGEGFVWRTADAAGRLISAARPLLAVLQGGGEGETMHRQHRQHRQQQQQQQQRRRGGGRPLPSPSSSSSAPATAVAAADAPVHAELVAVGAVSATVSFRADRAARPRWARRLGPASWALDVASFERAPLQLPGFEIRSLHTRAAADFWRGLLSRARRQASGAALALLRSFGVLSGASGVLGALSDGVAAAAGDDAYAADRAAARGGRAIGGVGEGLAAGGSALARGFLRGATGLLAKPLEGALRGGAGGFVRGIGSGIVGAVAQPVSGGLDFVSSALEGVDAAASGLAERAGLSSRPCGSRRRLPRVARGPPGVGLRPLGGAGTSVGGNEGGIAFSPAGAARAAELGQALMRDASTAVAAAAASVSGPPGAALLAPPMLRAALAAAAVSGGETAGARGARSPFTSSPLFSAPAYDRHFVLPEDRCLLLTDGCVALLVAKGIAAAQRAAEAGTAFPASPLPQAPVLRWAVAWRDVLAAEARRSGPDAAVPDRVLLHRIGSGGNGGGGGGGNNSGDGGGGDDGGDDDGDLLPLALGIRTHSGWCQAEAIAATLERAAAARGVAAGGGGGAGGGSFSRAVGWGTGGSRWERAAAAAERASASASSLALASPSPVSLPPSLPCLDFRLIWTSRGVRGGGLGHRGHFGGSDDNTSSSSSSSRVSLWRPVPPPGYAATGDVAVLGVEPPPAPVAVYRLDDDDEGSSDTGSFGFDDDDGDNDRGKKNKKSSLPPTAPAAGFRLVWRHDGDCPLTLWEPLPPRGYRALGAAARGSAEPLRGDPGLRSRSARRPRGGDVACVRSDLCEPTRCFDAPVWTADPIAAAAASAAAGGGGFGRPGAGAAAAAAAAGATPHPFDPAVWRVSLWPVDAPSGGFIALRSLAKPAEGVALKARL